MMKLEDQHRDPALLNDEMERIFSQHFLANLKGPQPFVRLESEDVVNQSICTMLISATQECTNIANGVLICSK
jgi:hypothetical protein